MRLSPTRSPRGLRDRAATLLAVAGLACVLALVASAAPPKEFRYRSLALGSLHTCALTTTGGVKCWGGNSAGELGNRTKGSNTARPVTPIGLASGVAAVTAGDEFSCAVSRGGARCWGDNLYGMLGNGSTKTSMRPVAVVGLKSGVRAIDAAAHHACALTGAGGVKCWGTAILGNGSTNLASYTPVDVVGLTSGVTAISAGPVVTCALTGAGGVKCWGAGVLGSGGPTPGVLTPVDVAGLSTGVKEIEVGSHAACALTTAGGVKCWGENAVGQLGTGKPTVGRSYSPVDVSGLSTGVTAIAVGHDHACAIARGGVVKCWGANLNGSVGVGDKAVHASPVTVAGLGRGVRAIAAGDYHTCAITREGVTKCWGNNIELQLGVQLPARRGESSRPVTVFGQSG